MLSLAINNFVSLFKNRKKAMFIILISIAISICGVLYGFSLYKYFIWLNNSGIKFVIENTNDMDYNYYFEKTDQIIEDEKISDITFSFQEVGSLKYSVKDNYYLLKGRKLQNYDVNEIVLDNMHSIEGNYDVGDEIELNDEVFKIVGVCVSGNYINKNSLEKFELEKVMVHYDVLDNNKNYYKYYSQLEEVFGEGTVGRQFRYNNTTDALANIGFYVSILLILLAILNMSFQFNYIVNCNKSLNRALIISGYEKAIMFAANSLLTVIITSISYILGEVIYFIVNAFVNIEISLNFGQHMLCLVIIFLSAISVSNFGLLLQLRGKRGARL